MDVITFPVNRKTTSGLQILLHSVISLPDATSCDSGDNERIKFTSELPTLTFKRGNRNIFKIKPNASGNTEQTVFLYR